MIRIVLLVILLYALGFSLFSLIKSLISKKATKYNFFKKKSSSTELVEYVSKEENPKDYLKVNIFHFINIIALAAAIITFVKL